MSLDPQQKEALENLYSHRDHIEDHLNKIDTILKMYFPKEYNLAYQHWLPQIKTGLRDDIKWLPRGQYSMDYTLKKLFDKMIDDLEKGVSKYI
jgi:enoyl reductase-like protein